MTKVGKTSVLVLKLEEISYLGNILQYTFTVVSIFPPLTAGTVPCIVAVPAGNEANMIGGGFLSRIE